MHNTTYRKLFDGKWETNGKFVNILIVSQLYYLVTTVRANILIGEEDNSFQFYVW